MDLPADHSTQKNVSPTAGSQSVEYAPYPKVDIADVDPPPQAMRNDTGYVDMSVPAESNPYVTPASVPSSSKNTMESVKDVFGKWGKKLGDTAKKTEDLAGNVWQHHLCKHHLMQMFSCFPTFLVGKKKRFKVLSERGRRQINPKGYLKPAIGRQEGSSKESFQIKPSSLVTLSTEHDKKEHSLSVSTFLSIENGTSFIPIESEDGSFMRQEYTIATVYEELGDNTEIYPMKREYSDLDLQPKGEIFSHGSSNDLDSHALEKETSSGISVEEAMIQGGNVRNNPTWLMQTAFMNSPVLTRSCSDIEIWQIKQWINLRERSSSCSILKNLSGIDRVRICCKTLRSSFSSRISYSADCKMLSSLSMSQVLPSHCQMILRKLLLLRHRNFQKLRYPQRIIAALVASNQKGGNLTDSHESGQKFEELRKKENQSAAISLGTSQIDRVNSWISNLDIDDFCDVEKQCDKQTAVLTHMELVNSSENNISDTYGSATEVEKVNDIIQSLNSFSSVAHFCYLGLNTVPTMSSAFLCLRSVNLSGNNIDSITPGSLPKSLHTLDLGWNKISTIEGLKDLERLRVLNLSHNRITRISHGLANCTLIKELYLSGNKISNVEGLHRILKLRVLDLSFNKIITAKALGQLVANHDSILALNLQGNPLQRNISDDQLRKAVLSLLPHVVYLNKRPIKPERVREVVTESVAKAALGDTARSSKRKMSRRLSQGLRSSTICRIGDISLRDNSLRTIKNGKGRQLLAGRCKDEIGPIHM